MTNDDIDHKRCFRLFLTVIVIISLFSSCSKESKNNSFSSSPELISQKYDDIPVPIGFISIPNGSTLEENNNSLMTSYAGNSTIHKTTNFYKQTMEMNGWGVQDFSTAKEGLLFCNKPNRKSAISIRENIYKKNLNTGLVIFVQNKIEQNSLVEESNEEDNINSKKL